MREAMGYAELDGFIAMDALGVFVERMEHDPSFTNQHDARPLPFDVAVVMTYEGELLRNGGASGRHFMVRRDGVFAMSITLPDPADHLPVVRVFGDLEQAERFLARFKAHSRAWLLHNGEG